MTQKLVLASRNLHKIEELREILEPLGIELLSALDFPELEEVEEDEDTIKGNALKKARYTASIIKLPTLSDDTGLEVDALDGAPGVYSARYAGEKASYQENVKKVLEELKHSENRKARFRTVVAFVSSDDELTFEGICEGEILTRQKGEGGFGYDSIFRPRGYEKTFAQLEPEEKNKISHRGRAIQEFIKNLKCI